MVCDRARSAVLGVVAAVLCGSGALAGPADAVQLANGRAYELVSPPGKNGSDVIQETNKTHVANNGNGVTFSALGGFGVQQGTSFDSEYLSRRTGLPGTNGWSTRGINPRGGSDTFAATALGGENFPSYVDAFTPDLSTAIYQSWRPLTDAPNVAEVTNLYRISGLGDASASAQLMSDAVAPMPATWPAVIKLFISPRFAAASTDLRHVVFESTLALTADAPPYQGICAFFGAASLFGCPTHLYENADGAVRLVSRIPSAGETTCDDVNGPSCVAAASAQAGISASLKRYSQQMISKDGRRIFFQAPAGAESGAIYMREDGVRTTQLAPDGQLWAASDDGSRVFFIASASLLPEDTDSSPDLYMYDSSAPVANRLTLVSASAVDDGNVHTVIGASADGRYVYFVCAGQLVPGEPAADLNGVYLWHDGALAYIGQVADSTEAQLNGPRTGWNFVSSMKKSRLTPDGRHLLFMTTSDADFRGREGFAGYDHAGHQELYLYSADTNRLVCASCNPSGRPATADAVTGVREGVGISVFTSDLANALSDDGQHAFFSTAEALVPEDTNGVADAYEYDTTSASVHLLSSGTDRSPSYFIDASNDGANAFFVTRERLLGWDVDDAYDLYDARVGGGFPEPVISPPACSGEACLDQGAAAPAAGGLGSALYRGAGDRRARLRRHRRRCVRGKVPRKVRGKKRCLSKRRARRHAARAQVSDSAER